MSLIYILYFASYKFLLRYKSQKNTNAQKQNEKLASFHQKALRNYFLANFLFLATSKVHPVPLVSCDQPRLIMYRTRATIRGSIIPLSFFLFLRRSLDYKDVQKHRSIFAYNKTLTTYADGKDPQSQSRRFSNQEISRSIQPNKHLLIVKKRLFNAFSYSLGVT